MGRMTSLKSDSSSLRYSQLKSIRSMTGARPEALRPPAGPQGSMQIPCCLCCRHRLCSLPVAACWAALCGLLLKRGPSSARRTSERTQYVSVAYVRVLPRCSSVRLKRVLMCAHSSRRQACRTNA
jgi:hypothetical protein